MKYYDFHVQSDFSEGESSVEEFASRAKLLGYSGICFSEYFQSRKQMEDLKKKFDEVSKKNGINVLLGFRAKNGKQLKKLVGLRKNYDLLLVEGGDIECEIL